MTDDVADHMAVPADYPIPLQLRNENFRFIKVDKGDRSDGDPKQQFKKATERDWPDSKNYAWDHPEIVGWIMYAGGNYGVMPRGDVSIIDLDGMEPGDALALVADLGPTFAVQTGSGKGIHVYIECPTALGKFHFEAAPPDAFHGDFYGPNCRAFVVGPGGRHWTGGTYQIIRDLPVARVPPDRLAAFLARCKYEDEPKPLTMPGARGRDLRATLTDQLGLRIEDVVDLTGLKWLNDQYQGKHPLHDSTGGMNFTVSPSKNRYYCHRHKVGGDPVSYLAMLANPGVGCDEIKHGGVTDERFQRVIDHLWYEKGYAERLSELGYRATPRDTGPVPPAPLGPDGQPVAADGTPLWVPPPPQVAHAQPQQSCIPDLADIADLLMPFHPTLEVNLEPDHFISRYMRLCGRKTDAYHEFHFAGALTILSVVAQRCAAIHLLQEEIYPCIWTFWIGQSSQSRKSTSIKFARAILEGQPEIRNSAELDTDFTPESFIESMADRPRAYLVRDEAAGLLAKLKKPYMGAMQELFCQVYDGNNINKRLTAKRNGQKNEFRVNDPYLTMLLATTPDGFEKEAMQENLTSGWFYRYLWIWPNRTKTASMPLRMKDPTLYPEEAALSEWARRLFLFFSARRSQTGGQDQPILFGLSDAQFERFYTWTNKHENDLAIQNVGDKIGIFARLQIYVLKLAMLFTIGQAHADRMMDAADGPIPIPDRYLDEAIQMVENHFMPVAFDVYDRIDLAGSNNDQKKIIKALTQHGGRLLRRDLGKRVRMKKRDFDEALQQLLDDTGEIVEYTTRTPKGHVMVGYALRGEEPR